MLCGKWGPHSPAFVSKSGDMPWFSTVSRMCVGLEYKEFQIQENWDGMQYD